MGNAMRRVRQTMIAGLLVVGMLAVVQPVQASFDSRLFRLRNGCWITAERSRNDSVIYAFTVRANRRCKRLYVAIVFETCSGHRGRYSSGWRRGSVEQHVPAQIKVIRTIHGGSNGNGRRTARWPWGWNGC